MATAAPTADAGVRTDGLPTRVLARLAARVLLPAVLAVALLVVLVYAVFPTATWLDQRATIDQRRAELVRLEGANEDLVARVSLLGSNAEIERIARRDHGLVKPGEIAYAVLPPAPAQVRLPKAWPFTELVDVLGS